MITIICEKGLIDTSGCRIHIEDNSGYTSLSGEIQVPSSGYSLRVTSLKKKKIDFAISDSFDKASAERVYEHILSAVKNGKKYVDIRDEEKWKSTLEYPEDE